MHTTYPVHIPLPNGLRAELVYALPLQDPPVYAIDGVPVWLDVTVPSDLQKRGWVWNGAFLWLPAATSGACGIGICTASSPPPFWNVARDGRILVPGLWQSCFRVARYLDVGEREGKERRVAALAATAAKLPRMKQTTVQRRPVAVQTMMELNV
jgi:hypothetical protein